MSKRRETGKAEAENADTPERDRYVLSAALPYKIEDGELQVLLITSRDTGRWVTPRGRREKGETYAEAAKREAREEAGIRGEIIPRAAPHGAIGSYQSFKQIGDRKVPSQIHLFLLEVKSLAGKWREQNVRKRQWAKIGEAIALIAPDPLESGLAPLLDDLRANPPAERKTASEASAKPGRPDRKPGRAHGRVPGHM